MASGAWLISGRNQSHSLTASLVNHRAPQEAPLSSPAICISLRAMLSRPLSNFQRARLRDRRPSFRHSMSHSLRQITNLSARGWTRTKRPHSNLPRSEIQHRASSSYPRDTQSLNCSFPRVFVKRLGPAPRDTLKTRATKVFRGNSTQIDRPRRSKAQNASKRGHSRSPT